MLFQEILFSLPFFSQLASCDQIRAKSRCSWLLHHFNGQKKTTLVGWFFPQAQLVAGLLSTREAFNEHFHNSVCVPEKTLEVGPSEDFKYEEILSYSEWFDEPVPVLSPV